MAPRSSINQQVQVANLDPSLQPYTEFWINDYSRSGYTWIYELRTQDGITFLRSEDQVLPLPEPTVVPVYARYSRESWDWTMPLALAEDADTKTAGTLVHIQSELLIVNGVRYWVRDFVGRVASVQIENAYFDTRTDEWFYYVRLPDGGRMPLRESDLTSTGITG